MAQNIIDHGMNVFRRYKIAIVQPGIDFAQRSRAIVARGLAPNITIPANS